MQGVLLPAALAMLAVLFQLADDVFFTVNNTEAIALVHNDDITRCHPTILKYFSSRFRTLPIATHDLFTFNPKLSRFTKLCFQAIIFDNFNIGIWHRYTNCAIVLHYINWTSSN